MPVVGFVHAGVPEGLTHLVAAFRKGLGEAGYVEGKNVSIEFRWAEGPYDRLPVIAADLVRRQVTVIVAGSIPAALAVKEATATIPIVFSAGADPVHIGLVASPYDRPEDRTGVNSLGGEVAAKGLELVRELVPNIRVIGFLVNPSSPEAD